MATIQGELGGKINIFEGDSIGHFEKKKSSYKHVSNSEWLMR
jgi:hypothetical protein